MAERREAWRQSLPAWRMAAAQDAARFTVARSVSMLDKKRGERAEAAAEGAAIGQRAGV